jgi:hypothetical protein
LLPQSVGSTTLKGRAGFSSDSRVVAAKEANSTE